MYHRTDLAERLLQTAEAIARRREMSAVTMPAVAAEVGVDLDMARTFFPDDTALREALVNRYYDANGEIFDFILRDIETIDDAVAKIQQAVALYYDIFIRDPQMSDVWAEILSSRGLRPLTLARMKAMVAGLVARIQKLVPRLPRAEVAAQIELMVHMTDVAARWAAVRDAGEGRAFLREFNRLVELIAADLKARNAAA